MNALSSLQRSVRRGAGFSLIELLVGIAISLIGVLVMFRMVTLWDLHTRTTTSGGDAQVTGTLAIFALERDIKPAGMGFGAAAVPAMGCNVQANDVGPPARAFNFPLVPVSITPGAGAIPDQISVLYGNSSFYVSEEPLQGSTATDKTLRRRGGFRPGDLAVVAGNPGAGPGSADCALIEITGDLNVDNRTVDHGVGNYTDFYTGAMKPVRFNTGGVGVGFLSGTMYSLGPDPQLRLWQITGGKVLSQRDVIHSPATAFDVAEGVINLKAQYGIDADGNGRITDAAPNEWTNIPPADWTRVLAIRVAILVRSQQFERSADGDPNAPVGVTTVVPSWAGGPFVMTSVDGGPDIYDNITPNPNNWRFYRYRVFEKVIPLRNMIWGTSP
ncbi:MAG: PilW family protein [Pseudomonadota bacterium]|nr:PilW family protein [Pseudomonadota bacterium]